EILRLREEWKRQKGASFRLGEFHDRLLSYGMPPIRIVRMALLGDAGRGGGSSASASEDAGRDQSSAIDFSVLATGTISGYEGPRRVELVTNENDWQRTWRVIGNDRRAPEVNFNTRAVVVVYQGQKPTGGYSISITEIRRDGTNLAVRVNERRPASEDITTQVITSPFVAVSIPRPPGGAFVKLDDGQNDVEQKPLNRKRIVTPRARRGTRRSSRRPG
ncbi:MAG: protease complex subunit PrcB family protein, partial [Acidobacteria bacterium]|nr:protease complex subunit PrcB family protein [Acidobacteriota bacterium]